MRPVSLEHASRLVHFDRGGTGNSSGSGMLQLEGAVALHNILVKNRFAYLADEVGMGKTYVALGAASLMRHANPTMRVMVIAPRENIQNKWIKEARNFAATNWQVVDNVVRGMDDRPAREQVACGSLADLARECMLSQDQDLFLRMTSFSPQFGVRSESTATKGRDRARERLRQALPHLPLDVLSLKSKMETFRDAYGRILNSVVPAIDLLIVDEAHNYKHGLIRQASLRNHLTALTFGHPAGACENTPTYGHRIRRVLLLSATPFEHDYADLFRTLDLFGFGGNTVVNAAGEAVGSLKKLVDDGVDEDQKRQLLGHFMVRRATGLQIGGEIHTKNMYRREWRRGGIAVHDEPMAITDPKERLIVALVQKKVAEVLGSEKFNNRFQIGMLSSFESFLQSATGSSVSLREADDEEADDGESVRVFDGDQSDLEDEVRRGIDAAPLASLLRSYQKAFGHALPHPKLDATVRELEKAFASGDKTLVFVRRIATMTELAARLNDCYDRWLERYMIEQLPGLADEVTRLFERYRGEKSNTRNPAGQADAQEVEVTGDANAVYDHEEETSGSETFFAWFFRGKENRGVLSGAAFQKNRLISPSSAYSILFEDDHVSALLGRPADVLGALAVAVATTREELLERLRERAFALFAGMGRRTEGYPRLYVFEAYQAAALDVLQNRAIDEDLRRRAQAVRQEAYPPTIPSRDLLPAKFPQPEAGLGVTTFVTMLYEDRELGARLLPAPPEGAPFEQAFRERERRRELLSALSRLGASYVDLYLLAIRRLGSFELSAGVHSPGSEPAFELARDYLALLRAQADAPLEARAGMPGFLAYRELAGAAEAFDDIVSTNFPQLRERQLWEMRREFGTVLQNQSPVAISSRSKVKRLVQQFRMPGYPLVLVTTDILQEGEDLHTFCSRVMHYGITWTPSGMEQRTGRVDRIGSLTQRRLDRSEDAPHPEHKIQVYYPHLRDTVEVLQVERVLARLNRFTRMVHSNADAARTDARQIDTAREMVAERPEIEPITHRLESAFPIQDGWLATDEESDGRGFFDVVAVVRHFEAAAKHLQERARLRVTGEMARVEGVATGLVGEVLVGDVDASAVQPVRLNLMPQRAGRQVLLRIRCDVGELDLEDQGDTQRAVELLKALKNPKLCIAEHPKHRTWVGWLERDMIFHPETSQLDEIEHLLAETVQLAREWRRGWETEDA